MPHTNDISPVQAELTLENITKNLQSSIAERIRELLGYEIHNVYLIKFLNEFGDLNQLKCSPKETEKRLYQGKISTWEKLFTDSFYRAAIIVAQREKAKYPEIKGINMEDIILGASELLQQEHENTTSAWREIGYGD